MDRPTVIQCQATLGDGTTCGADVEVGVRGNIPKYCLDHRDPYLRKTLQREAEIAAAAVDTPDVVEIDGDDVRVCRPASCSIPLAEPWDREFCPAHWRLLTTEVKGGLLAAEVGTHAYDVQVLRALREISKVEGRMAYESDQAFEEASSPVG